MTARTTTHRLQVATELHRFIEDQVLPAVGVTSDVFWRGFDAIVHDLAPKNVALLAERDRLQAELDAWHKAHPGPIADMPAYRSFLSRIGYLVTPPAQVRATTGNVDAELALQAGPQLVVPILNARYALNAANARWGSLYDALYGTDVLPETGGAQKGPGYNEVRGAKVIEYARYVLDRTAPLKKGSHIDSTGYAVKAGKLVVSLKDGTPDPGVCANPACDAACDAPAAVAACDARCQGTPTYDICMADCASSCHTFCGGQVPGQRYLDLAYAFAGVAANVCSDDASPGLSRLSAVIGIPKQVLLRAQPSAPELLVVRVERGGHGFECVPGQGYDIVTTSDGPAVQFAGDCLLQPDDTWDVRYLTNR